MYYFFNFNISKSLEENLKNVKEIENTIFLFNIKLDKNKSHKLQLEQIRKLKLENKETFQNIALLIEIEKIENYISGLIAQLKQEFSIIVGQGGLNKINRFFLEQTQIDFLLDPHTSKYLIKHDFIHHLNSGMNHILFKLAQEKNINVLIDLNSFDNNKMLFKDIGRINQNLMLARKNNVKTIFTKFNKNISQNKIKHISNLFNISNNQIIESQNYLKYKIQENKNKKSNEYLIEGISYSNS